MPTNTSNQIVVSENAGILDTLAAAGRYLVVILGAVPLLLALLGQHNFGDIIAYFRSSDGASLIAAVSGLVAIAYGLFKTHKRGSQIATVAASDKVPASIATTK